MTASSASDQLPEPTRIEPEAVRPAAATTDGLQAAPAATAAAPVPPEQPWGGASLQQLRTALQHFAAERDWGQYHTPRNLLLALVGEAGELAECFQWKGEVAAGLPGFSPQERQHVGEELADVLLYLLRLADSCHIDLAAAAEDKLQKNANKYPADACRGSSAKYTAYATLATQKGGQAQQQQGGHGQQQQNGGQAHQQQQGGEQAEAGACDANA